MNEYERCEINRIRHLMSEEMDSILEIKDKQERTDKGLVIFRMNKILDNYDELTPILNKFFEEKHYKEKWGLDKGKNE
jgi:hypothetical protein